MRNMVDLYIYCTVHRLVVGPRPRPA